MSFVMSPALCATPNQVEVGAGDWMRPPDAFATLPQTPDRVGDWGLGLKRGMPIRGLHGIVFSSQIASCATPNQAEVGHFP